MDGSYDFTDGIGGDMQMQMFQNATQTTLGDDARSIAIAVKPSFPSTVDVEDAAAVDAHLRRIMQPLVDAGFEIEIQYGDFN